MIFLENFGHLIVNMKLCGHFSHIVRTFGMVFLVLLGWHPSELSISATFLSCSMESQEVLDAELSARVLQLINVTDSGLHSQVYQEW